MGRQRPKIIIGFAVSITVKDSPCRRGNSADHALQAVKSATKHPCVDYIDFQIKVQINRVETAAKVDRTRTECLHESNRHGWRRRLSQNSARMSARENQSSGMPVNVYRTQRQMSYLENISSMETVLVLPKSNKINRRMSETLKTKY